MIGSLAHVPVHPRNKGSRVIEEILLVVKIENRKAAVGLGVVTRREMHDQIALVAQVSRGEPLVPDKVR